MSELKIDIGVSDALNSAPAKSLAKLGETVYGDLAETPIKRTAELADNLLALVGFLPASLAYLPTQLSQ